LCKKSFPVFILILVFTLGDVELFAQDNLTVTISGRVSLPVVKRERRTFRGRLYRNRLAAKSRAKSRQTVNVSNFTDIIVSAHPLSFQSKAPATDTVKIIQTNATFVPRVTPITPGTEVQFINLDKFFHNVFSITPGERFNIGRKPTGVVESRRIYQLGETKLFCDIHAQMNATVLCLDTPYFTRVTSSGRYKLEDLPPGSYEIRAYHPDFPELSIELQMAADEEIEQDFNFNR